MTLWTTVLLASGLSFSLKFLGYVVPHRTLDHPVATKVTGMLPIALLSALVAVQTFGAGGGLTLDARAAGVAVAVTALLLRAPFLVIVILAAATAATLRALGWG